ncbi:chaperonin GroEL [Marinomonas sp. MED121]|uniref:DUF6463 family protein n=1 Tax=Marinomonas sp. MED121 TaxID=314277 RepID=UPI000068FA61|nr:DUF6463 family protein [Marinomonas sp. MED121]EAQ64185.1 chaperonin GroEL [Marinomonas sp. MED121]
MKNWISKWIIFVAVGHTAVAMMLYSETYRVIIQSGMFNAVSAEKSGLAVWFLFFGFLLFTLAILIAVIEKNDSLVIPKSFGIALLLLTTLGVLLMPASGFWLVFPPAIAVTLKKQTGLDTIKT